MTENDPIQKEYAEFRTGDPIDPPQALSERVLESVKRELVPNAWEVFAKLFMIHLVVGLATLAVCPQFGVRTLGKGPGLMELFLFLGPYGCMAACGAFFLGSSFLVAALLLSKEEIARIRRHRTLQLGALTTASLGAFLMLDAQILIGIGAAWVFGSLMGGALMLETGWLLRRSVSAA